ncbi:hypothetical protein [Iningainema tapete]|uniref:Uncharacterized protein n=1 Tax=Iningainema tapete BLCC-T55 TaxID=2748662 RepID=A0A8J7CFZ4_9CYAN|nr:hypothetical protein [Iningainema tapete]MBD2775635.1 hypothetical protein [Iningainema tapete BLCC-T55]
MKNYHRIKLRETLRSSYWFVPTLMTGAAIALAFFMLTRRGGNNSLTRRDRDDC